MQMSQGGSRYVIERNNNIVRVDFRRPDPPAPNFPGAGALRRRNRGSNESANWIELPLCRSATPSTRRRTAAVDCDAV